MESLSDSSAFYDENRQLAQHQSILTIIQGILGDPKLTLYSWLDLACGKGQIIAQLEKNLNEESRAKIEYFGYDIQNEYIKITEKKASSLNLKSFRINTGEISHFPDIYDSMNKFDLITLTNTVHEIMPTVVSSLLFESLIRLNSTGYLFIYDIEKLPNPELGAITWKKTEFEEIVKAFLENVGINDINPISGQWQHQSCMGWNIQLKREYFDIDIEETIRNKHTILEGTNAVIKDIIDRKFEDFRKALESLTLYGPENKEEQNQIIEYLHGFWAISRAKESIR